MTGRQSFVQSAAYTLAVSELPINEASVWRLLSNGDMARMATRLHLTDDDLNHRQLARLAGDIIRRAEKAREYARLGR